MYTYRERQVVTHPDRPLGKVEWPRFSFPVRSHGRFPSVLCESKGIAITILLAD